MAARRRRDNVLIAVLAVLSVLGGGHAILDAFSSDPPPPVDNTANATIGRAQLAGSFAARFVVTYLSSVAGQQDRLGEFIAASGQVTLPGVAKQVSEPMVVYLSREVRGDALDVWSVTVSVRVGKAGVVPVETKTGAAADTKSSADGPQFYRVAVSVGQDGRLRALSLPAIVEAPNQGPELALAYSAPCTVDTPLAQVASGFLTTLLTGTGDLSRYTTLDAGIVALRPAPYTTLDTVTVTSDNAGCGTSGSAARVLATVNPKGDGGAAATLAYPLTMVRNGGQWQVQTVDSIPALSNPLAVIANQDSHSIGPSSGPSTTTSAPSTSVRIPPATQK